LKDVLVICHAAGFIFQNIAFTVFVLLLFFYGTQVAYFGIQGAWYCNAEYFVPDLILSFRSYCK
jgi:hypothetical protein